MYLKDSIVGVVDEYVKSDQIAGFTGDGVYTHCEVPEMGPSPKYYKYCPSYHS